MNALLQDVKYGLRQLRKNPGFSAVAVLTLALGIGANTAIFSVVNAVLLRPLPYPQPDRIVQVMKQYKDGTGSSVSVPLFNYWREHNQVFQSIMAFSGLAQGYNLSTTGLPERVPGVQVTAGFFKVMGVSPALGRGFLLDEDRPGGARAVVISHGLWRSHFHEDPQIVGKLITIGGEPYSVVGVMPEGFSFPPGGNLMSGTDLWIPFQLPPDSRDPANYLAVFGRLKPGVTRPAAAAELSALVVQLAKDFPQAIDESEGAALVPLHERMVGRVRPVLLILLAAVCFVLLIACVNVANLLLSRSAARAKEMAIRAALGAGRWRVVHQLIVESVLLGVCGGVAGLAVAHEGDRALIALTPMGIPGLAQAGLDARVLLFALGASMVTGILFGLAPAITISGTNLSETLKEGSTRSTAGGHRRRLSGALVAGETALALVLLVGAGLMLESFIKLAHVAPGFDPHNVLTFETTLAEAKYGTPPPFIAFSRQVLERLQAIPVIEDAGLIGNLPTEFGPDLPYVIEGRPVPANGESGDSQYRITSADYFRAMKIPLIQGRTFTDADSETSQPVVIINQTMARMLWKNENPIGQTIIIGKSMGPEWTDQPRQIVGVVGDVKDDSLNRPAPPEMFIPYTQVPAHVEALQLRLFPLHWVVRMHVGAVPVQALRQAVLSVDAQQPIASVKSMEEVLSGSISRWRFNMFLLGIFAALALTLAGVGTYGVISYSVSQRTHEIGIRMALGARREDILKLVIGQGFRLTLIGVGIGVVGALALTRFLSSLLYGVKPTDPLTFAAVALLMIAVALAACYIPARRATKVDPMIALRYE